MAVAYDASSYIGNQSNNFNFNHTPVGTPKGVLVFVNNIDTGDFSDNNSAVTYGGVSMTAVTGGFAQDTVGEPCAIKTWFLGSSIPTGLQSVAVSTTGGLTMSACCITVTADVDTEYTGVFKLEEDTTLSEQNIDDGSPGTNSVRFAGISSGRNTPPSAGTNSTVVQSDDYGVTTVSYVRETTAGQGSRPVGWSDGVLDDCAAVFLAIREISAGDTGDGLAEGDSSGTGIGASLANSVISGSGDSTGSGVSNSLINYTASGGFILSGSYVIPELTFSITASGGFILSGNPEITTNNLIFPETKQTVTNIARRENKIIQQKTLTYTRWGHSKKGIVPSVTQRNLGKIW